MKYGKISMNNYKNLNGYAINYVVEAYAWEVVVLRATEHRNYATGESLDQFDQLTKVFFLGKQIASWREYGDNSDGQMEINLSMVHGDKETVAEWRKAIRDGLVKEVCRS